jgi:hypothetical protein
MAAENTGFSKITKAYKTFFRYQFRKEEAKCRRKGAFLDPVGSG